MRQADIKLARLRRIKRRKRREPGFSHFARLYWRQHFRVYGPHANLWSIEQ